MFATTGSRGAAHPARRCRRCGSVYRSLAAGAPAAAGLCRGAGHLLVAYPVLQLSAETNLSLGSVQSRLALHLALDCGSRRSRGDCLSLVTCLLDGFILWSRGSQTCYGVSE